MKRKKYKVTVKATFVTTMDHEQTSIENAKNDIKKVVENYLKDGKDIRNIFDKSPKTSYIVKKYDR